jgi:hypothetical protein
MNFLKPMLLELQEPERLLPLPLLKSSKHKHLGTIIVNFTEARKRFYPPPPSPTLASPPLAFPSPDKDVISLTNLLLYGETSNPEENITDSDRIEVLFMLHLLLNEVIIDMIPDSFGKSLKIDTDIIRLLQQSYILSNSPDPSNHTQAQIEDARVAPSVFSVPQLQGSATNLANSASSSGIGTPSHAAAMTEDRFEHSIPSPGQTPTSSPPPSPPPSHNQFVGILEPKALLFTESTKQEGGHPITKKPTHRKPHRHTRNYQSRNKRKQHSSKKSSIKHRKSYRKHNRTIKRRKSRRHR